MAEAECPGVEIPCCNGARDKGPHDGDCMLVGDTRHCPSCRGNGPAVGALTPEEESAVLAGAAALDLYRDESQGDILRDLVDRLTGEGKAPPG